ncbi:hypothetical protein [Salmonella enterica]|uniref:hypothetical protein n=1 Tax=Salmonella enterica TaxID=28901 RepID=UPI0009A99819|nr:hypothetical protein [Salmonella enterica]HBC0155113.1 hypothetical protein [Salmonella enterica subsp. indica]
MTTIIRTKLGTHRGSRRVWFEGTHLMKEGFLPGMKFDVEKYESHIIIRLNIEGKYKISKRTRGGKAIPIIDLTFQELAVIFDGIQIIESIMDNGTITITGCRKPA